MDSNECKDKPLSCGICDNHVCLKYVHGSNVGLRVAQMVIMQCMDENKNRPEIMCGLEVALTKITERIMGNG